MDVTGLHHVLLPVTDLGRAKQFYGEVLGLPEVPRPDFEFRGAWYRFPNGQEFHLVCYPHATLRGQKSLDDRDIHVALRVSDFGAAVERLRAAGYREDVADDDGWFMVVRPHSSRGYSQVYVLDPDRNVIELNAEFK
jgi:glyoxylase I family protein